MAKDNPFAPRTYGELHRVTDRVYIFRNITNSSFVIGSHAVAVIDTQVNRPTAQRLLSVIRCVTDKPIKYVINTHYHWDHTNGNAVFKKEGAVVVSSALTKEFMATRHKRQKAFLEGRGFLLSEDPLLPDETFQGQRRIDLGGLSLRLFYAGSAETEDATAVEVPEEAAVMAGDTVMTGSFPIFGQPVWDEGLEGDSRWQETLATLMALKPAHLLPGHGPLADRKSVELLLKIEDYFVEQVRPLASQGLGADEVLRRLEPRLPQWITGIPVVWGTPRYAILRVYRGLTKKSTDAEPGWQQFKPSAIPQASPSKLDPARDLNDIAREAREGGDTALWLAALKRDAELRPDSPEALTVYADALIEASRAQASVLEKGDFFEAAKRLWDSVLSVHPAHVGALLGKGRFLVMLAYRGGEDPEPGRVLLAKALEQKPSGRARAEIEFYLGMVERRLGNEIKAKLQFGKARQADPAFMPAVMAASA